MTAPTPCQAPGADPDDWFATPGSTRELRARLACMQCPLYWDCQDDALTLGIQFGTWGGQDERTRQRIWKQAGGMPRTFTDGVQVMVDQYVRTSTRSAAQRERAA